MCHCASKKSTAGDHDAGDDAGDDDAGDDAGDDDAGDDDH